MTAVYFVVSWALTTMAGLADLLYAHFRRPRIHQGHRKSLWFAALAAAPGSVMMVKFPVRMLGGSVHFATWFGPHPYDIVLSNLALVALIIGPAALAKSVRITGLLRAPAHVNVARGAFAMSWSLSSFVTVMTCVYV
jgi:hypothetical protein